MRAKGVRTAQNFFSRRRPDTHFNLAIRRMKQKHGRRGIARKIIILQPKAAWSPSLRLLIRRLIAIKEVRNYGKIVCIKKFF